MGFISSPGGNNLTLSSVDRTTAANAASGMTPESQGVIFLGENCANLFNGSNVVAIGTINAGGDGAGWGGAGAPPALDSVIVGNYSATTLEGDLSHDLIILGTFTEPGPLNDAAAASFNVVMIGNQLDFSNVTGDGLQQSVVISTAPLFYPVAQSALLNGIVINAGIQPSFPNPNPLADFNGVYIVTNPGSSNRSHPINVRNGMAGLGYDEIGGGEGILGFYAVAYSDSWLGTRKFLVSGNEFDFRYNNDAGADIRLGGLLYVPSGSSVNFGGTSFSTGSNDVITFNADVTFTVQASATVSMGNYAQTAGKDVVIAEAVTISSPVSIGAGGGLTLDANQTVQASVVGGLGTLKATDSGGGFTRFGYTGAVVGLGEVSGAACANGAAAQVGTLNNAPAAGNPTKWIPFNDNGTVRYLPAW